MDPVLHGPVPAARPPRRGDDAVAHDALQQSWIIVLQKLRQYQGGPPACSWVAAIVRHEATHGLMAERRHLPLGADGEPAEPGRRARPPALPRLPRRRRTPAS